MCQKNESYYLVAVNILLKQIENESTQSMLWLVSSVNKCLLENEDMSLIEFKNLIKLACPDFFTNYKRIMNEKRLTVID